MMNKAGALIDRAIQDLQEVRQLSTDNWNHIYALQDALAEKYKLARDIVALLFWRWRSALHTLAVYESKKNKQLIAYGMGMESQAHNDFVAAYNAYYGKWD